MALPKSSSLIRKIQKARGSSLISYITSDRQPGNLLSTKIASDVIDLFYEHLKGIGKVKRISLFLNSSGGSLDTPWPLVNLIREFCDYFEVIVPRYARSAATLISLGANKIVMTPLSQLSPIDPEGSFDGGKVRIEVENISGFLDFAMEKVGLNEQESLTEALKLLAAEVKPTILGSLNRTHSLIRRLAENLLKTHLTEMSAETQLCQIVENLTEKLFSHQHMIGRREAKDIIGFKDIIQDADEDMRSPVDGLLSEYFGFIEELSVFNPESILGAKNQVEYVAHRAVIESLGLAHVFESHITIKKENQQIEVKPTSHGWIKYERGNKHGNI